MAAWVAGLDGSEGSEVAEAGIAAWATKPAVMAPLALRNSRRFFEECVSPVLCFMITSQKMVSRLLANKTLVSQMRQFHQNYTPRIK
jgi:hypothetical protein